LEILLNLFLVDTLATFYDYKCSGSLPPVQIDFPAIQEGAGGGGPATTAADGGAPNATATTSIEDFIATFKKPLTPPVLSSPPRLR
jgi:hypothetical protein